MAIKVTSTYWKIKALNSRHRVIQGGQGAGKTFAIIIILFLLAVESKAGIKITIVSDSYPSLKDGAIDVMKQVVEAAGMSFEANYNKTEKNLILFNSEIQFRNVDEHNFEQLKGVRRDFLFVNESTKVNFITVDQMITRSKVIFYDFNPDKEFWVHKEIVNRDDADFISVTYLDNELLSIEEREEIERRVALSKLPDASEQLKNWVRIYAYGQIGTYSERQIYSYDFIDEIPPTAKKQPSGMDVGTNDKTALIEIWQDGAELYIDERVAESGLERVTIEEAKDRTSIKQRFDELNISKGNLIICDSANKDTILDLRKYGYNIIGVKKTAPHVGIELVRGFVLHLTKRSVNVKKAIEGFYRKVDRDGKILTDFEGHEPDELAALRYSVMMKRTRWH